MGKNNSGENQFISFFKGQVYVLRASETSEKTYYQIDSIAPTGGIGCLSYNPQTEDFHTAVICWNDFRGSEKAEKREIDEFKQALQRSIEQRNRDTLNLEELAKSIR